jgi:hypothetical protein
MTDALSDGISALVDGSRAVLVVLGFVGFAFRQNRNAEPDEDNLKQATPSESIQAALELKAKGK